MLKNFARVFAAGAFALAAILPSTASAAGGGGGASGAVAISIAPTVTVSDKQILTLAVTETCPLLIDFNTGLPVTNNFGFASVQQVQGRVIAHAGGSMTTTCDGVTRTSVVTALAFDHPFRAGSGVAQASVFNLCGMVPGTFTFECLNGSALQSVSIVSIH